MKISYYELLELIKNGAEPKRIRVNVCNYPCEYVAEYDGEDFNFYRIADGYSEDDNYEYYLSECFIESMMFDKCIEIIEEDKEIEKIDRLSCVDFADTLEKTLDKLDELIDIVNELKNKD